jgi:hypothetical protein
MITARTIQRFCSAALIVSIISSFAVSFYLGFWNIVVIWLFISIFIFVTSFVMEWFHVSISDPILWLVNRFENWKTKRKIER